MSLSATCIACIICRQEESIRALGSESERTAYMMEVMGLLCEAESEVTVPVMTERITQLREGCFGKDMRFERLKRKYNQMMLEKEDVIRSRIQKNKNQMQTAIKYARAGNYIDFGAMGEISIEKLNELLSVAEREAIDAAEYKRFQSDLSNAKHLVYLTDNCGEIVFDKLLIQQLQREYPGMIIDVVVRGKPVLNDATLKDAEDVGLCDIAHVTGNGTGVAGTDLKSIAPEVRKMLIDADLIISKGQGNFEALHGCGLNIYYMFLCKCDWFVNRFHLARFQGVFVNESNHNID